MGSTQITAQEGSTQRKINIVWSHLYAESKRAEVIKRGGSDGFQGLGAGANREMLFKGYPLPLTRW